MKRLLGLLALIPGLALAQVQSNYITGQVLSAVSLNQNFGLAAAVTNGTLTNPTITGATITTPIFTAPVTVPNGGTGVNSVTNNGVVLGKGSAALSATSAGSTGQMLLGVTGSAPVFGNNPTITGGTVDGAPVGGTTPSTGAFTTLAASGTVSGAGITGLFASPPAIGGTAAAAGSFTTLTASSTVSGAGITGLFASPPAIGGTAAAAGTFTTLNATGVTHLTNTGAGAAVLELTGNGATTPNKWLGVLSGNFNIQNNAQSVNILSLTDAGALTVASSVTPSSTGGIVGTTTNDSANAGSVGEFITSNASGISLSNGVVANITTISLTAGDWDVTGQVVVVAAGTTVLQQAAGGVNTTSATMPTVTSGLGTFIYTGTLGTGTNPAGAIMPTRISVASTTTVYLVASALFTTSTCTANGYIRARRVR